MARVVSRDDITAAQVEENSAVYFDFVNQTSEKAAQLSLQEEASQDGPKNHRMSVAYKWMKENTFLLYELHKRESWAHY